MDRLFKIKRVTAQWNAYPDFKYCIEITESLSIRSTLASYFYEIFKWCWETNGPTIDLQIWKVLKKNYIAVNSIWSWDPRQSSSNLRIYFASSKELEYFLLKWG